MTRNIIPAQKARGYIFKNTLGVLVNPSFYPQTKFLPLAPVPYSLQFKQQFSFDRVHTINMDKKIFFSKNFFVILINFEIKVINKWYHIYSGTQAKNLVFDIDFSLCLKPIINQLKIYIYFPSNYTWNLAVNLPFQPKMPLYLSEFLQQFPTCLPASTFPPFFKSIPSGSCQLTHKSFNYSCHSIVLNAANGLQKYLE